MEREIQCAQPDGLRDRNLIGSEQWDTLWTAIKAPRRLCPWRDYLSWSFARVFGQYIKPGDRVLEVGCGGSRFLPYFAKDLGAEVWGFDFAPAGVHTATAALARAGVSGTILQADLFRPKDVPFDWFDVVFSAGFIEHFPDTASVLRHITHFAKPGTGLVITEIPNVGGWFFRKLQNWLDPELYAQHVAITPAQMDVAHWEAGAHPILPAEYFGTLNLGMLNYNRRMSRAPRISRALLRRSLEIPQFLITAPVWALRTRCETAAFSPIVLGVYKRAEI